MTPLGVIASGALHRMVFRAERGDLTQSVILSPFASLRVNSAKNLVEILRPCLRMTVLQSVPSLRSGQGFVGPKLPDSSQ
jgi:hypothetical protein